VAAGQRTASLRAAIGARGGLRAATLALLACQVVIAALVAAMTVLLHDTAGCSARQALIVVLVALVVGAGAQVPLTAASVRRYGSRHAVVISFGVLLGGIAVLAAALAIVPQGALGARSAAGTTIVPVLVRAGPVVLGAVLTATGGLMALSTATTALSASSDLGAGWVMGLSQSVAALGQLLGPALGILAVSLGAPIFLVGAAVVTLLGAVAIRESDQAGTART
jgi:MFS family permease